MGTLKNAIKKRPLSATTRGDQRSRFHSFLSLKRPVTAPNRGASASPSLPGAHSQGSPQGGLQSVASPLCPVSRGTIPVQREIKFSTVTVYYHAPAKVSRESGDPVCILHPLSNYGMIFPLYGGRFRSAGARRSAPFFPGVKTFFSPPSLPRKGVSPWLLMRNCFSIPW